MLQRRGEHVDDAAADGELTPPLDEVDAHVGGSDELVGEVIDIVVLADGDGDGQQLAEPGHLRLQHGADGSHDHAR